MNLLDPWYLVTLLTGLFIGQFLPAYFKQKGKNVATKEDISKITTLQEEVKATFQSIMNKQRAELNEKLELLKHQQSKLLKDYELYTVNKYENYPQLYKEIELSLGKIQSLQGHRKVFTFENVNKEDINWFMTDKKFTEKDKTHVLNNWDTENHTAIHFLADRLRRIEYNEAEEAYINANNFYLLHRLFFSDEISSLSRDLLDTMHRLWQNYSPEMIITGDPRYISHLNDENAGLNEKIRSLRKDVFKQMKKELEIERN